MSFEDEYGEDTNLTTDADLKEEKFPVPKLMSYINPRNKYFKSSPLLPEGSPSSTSIVMTELSMSPSDVKI
jgi:hypothetical protein